jgi:hypothetical protein
MKGLFSRNKDKEPKPADTLAFRFVTTDTDVTRRWLEEDYGLVFATDDLETSALKRLEAKAVELGANAVIGLRFGYDRDRVTAYGTARRYGGGR